VSDPLGVAIGQAHVLPHVLASFSTDPKPYVALMLLGFLIGIFGHIVRSKTLQAIGIGFVFLATLILPLVTNVIRT
jgi:hypothetical protein